MKLKIWGTGHSDQSSIRTSRRQKYDERFKACIKGSHNGGYSGKITVKKNGVNMILAARKGKNASMKAKIYVPKESKPQETNTNLPEDNKDSRDKKE